MVLHTIAEYLPSTQFVRDNAVVLMNALDLDYWEPTGMLLASFFSFVFFSFLFLVLSALPSSFFFFLSSFECSPVFSSAPSSGLVVCAANELLCLIGRFCAHLFPRLVV